MERLSAEQSAMLKRMEQHTLYYPDLTNDEKAICDFLIKRNFVSARYDTITCSSNGVFRSWKELTYVSIAEFGKMYLINEALSVDQSIYLQDQLNSLRDIAAAADSQASTAIEDSKQAARDALFSKVVSIAALAISAVSVIAQIVM